ncbi:Uncharacterised protein [Mycobacterium tuberculosis]|nr:Uncharacterised protein [Mycobacterium tuberculosis]
MPTIMLVCMVMAEEKTPVEELGKVVSEPLQRNLNRANSVKDKLSSEIAERARRLRGDEQKRVEKAE